MHTIKVYWSSAMDRFAVVALAALTLLAKATENFTSTFKATAEINPAKRDFVNESFISLVIPSLALLHAYKLT